MIDPAEVKMKMAAFGLPLFPTKEVHWRDLAQRNRDHEISIGAPPPRVFPDRPFTKLKGWDVCAMSIWPGITCFVAQAPLVTIEDFENDILARERLLSRMRSNLRSRPYT